MQDEWAPTYGAEWMVWADEAHTNKNKFFYEFYSATDADSDGRADIVEERTGTDPDVFNNIDIDSDGLHDWWEAKLFGNLSQTGFGDFDGDSLLNGEELVWVAGGVPVMYSDPSLYDTDGEGLDDGSESQAQTNPLSSDTDKDGRNDAAELLTLHTDPNHPDIIPPSIAFN